MPSLHIVKWPRESAEGSPPTLLSVNLKPSKTFFIIILFILSGALVGIYCSFLPYSVQLFLSMMVLFYSGRLFWREVLLRTQSAIVHLTCCGAHHWRFKERSGKEHEAFLCGSSTRLGFVSILRFEVLPRGALFLRTKAKMRTSVVFCDALDTASYRRMLMCLGLLKSY